VAEVQFTTDAIADLQALDAAVVRRVIRKLGMLRTNPEAGQPLGSRQTSNLTGFRKLLIANRQYRAVYRIEKSGAVCIVWVVAGRTDDECYDLALERLRQHGDARPEILDFAAMILKLHPAARAGMQRDSAEQTMPAPPPSP
jgi:mRNA interferase RelE/StbE